MQWAEQGVSCIPKLVGPRFPGGVYCTVAAYGGNVSASFSFFLNFYRENIVSEKKQDARAEVQIY